MTITKTTAATTDTTTPPAGTTTPPADPATTGGEGAPATDPPAKDGTPPADEWANFDADRAKRTIENQRRAEADLKRTNAELKAKVDEHERSKLTEQEKLTADLEAAKRDAEDARRAVTDMREQSAFDAAAIAAGIPPNALTAARAVAGNVASSDESGIVSVDATVFDRLKAEHGYLFGQQAAPQAQVSFGTAASQGPGGQQGAPSPDEVAMARKVGMTVDEWAKYSQRTKR